MLALLFAVALIALTALALALAGVLAAIVTGVALVNGAAALLGMRSRALHDCRSKTRERWRPRAFRLPPELEQEPDEEHARSLTVHRR